MRCFRLDLRARWQRGRMIAACETASATCGSNGCREQGHSICNRDVVAMADGHTSVATHFGMLDRPWNLEDCARPATMEAPSLASERIDGPEVWPSQCWWPAR